MRFASDTAVRKASDRRGPVAVYATDIRSGWDVGGNANGGYLLSIVGRAMQAATARPDPVTVTAHFLSPGRPGPAEVTVEVVKSGRSFTTAIATLSSGGSSEGEATRRAMQVVGAFGDLAGRSAATAGFQRVEGAPPDLPPVEECPMLVGGEVFPPPFMNWLQLHIHPDDAWFATGRPSGEALVRGWFRLGDDEPIDTIGLLFAVDSFPPAIVNAGVPMAWTPTVEFTAHVRARPEPGWLRCCFRTRFITGGFLEEDGEVWDESGRLVAQSRQLALLPRP